MAALLHSSFPTELFEKIFEDVAPKIKDFIKDTYTSITDAIDKSETGNIVDVFENIDNKKDIFINGKLEEIDFKFEEKDKVEISREVKKNKYKIDNEALLSLNNAFNNNFYKITIKNNYELKKPLIVYHTTNKEIESLKTFGVSTMESESNSSYLLAI